MTAAKWPEVRLDSVADVRLGRQRSPKNHSGTQMRPYVRAANIGWDGLKLDDVKEMNFTDDEMATYQLAPGDLLLGEASGSPSEVGKPAIWGDELETCAFQNTLLRVRPRGPEPRYLLHFFKFQAVSGGFAKRSRGVGIHHLGREALASLDVPLPPIEEQRRIAAVLDQANAVRAKRRESLAILESLTESMFREMFGDSMWPEVPMSKVVDRFEAGKSIDTNNGDEAAARCRVLKVSAVTSGRFEPGESKPVPPAYVPPVGHFVRQGDLLVSRANTEALVGATALVDEAPTDLLLSDKLWRFVWRHGAPVRPLYVWKFLQLPATRRAIGRLATGTSGSMKNISQAKLMTLPVPLPPLETQREFESRWCCADSTAHQLGASADELDGLFASLQQRAFRGDL